MGGLLIRAYLGVHRPVNLGRVVMIGTPNNGSEVADLLKGFRLYASLFGMAGQQLVTEQTAFRHLLADDGYDLGVIAGSSRLNPLSSLIFSGPNDGKVSVESTYLPSCRDHIVIGHNHTLLPLVGSTHREVVNFLRNGSFSDQALRIKPCRVAEAG